MAIRSKKRSTWASGNGKVPFQLDGVLRCQHQERARQWAGHPIRGHLALLHGFQQADWVRGVARLISSASTTWLMIGPGPEFKGLFLLVEPAQASHVRRQQVGRELDPPECAAQRDGQRRARVVLPMPGTSSSRIWPSHRTATRVRSMTSPFPTITFWMFSRKRRATSEIMDTSCIKVISD